MSQFTVLPAIDATNPSVGITGAIAPTSATEVGGVNPSGDLEALQLDSSGNLKVTVTSTPTPQNVNLTEVGGAAIALGATTSSASLPVVIASDQAAVAVKQTTASNLNATIVGTGTAGTPSGGVVSVQGVTGGTVLPVSITSATITDLSTNVAQFGGNNVVTGTGASGSGIPRVTVSNDSAVIVSQTTASSLNATVVQGTASNLLAQVSQPTASSLNATVVGAGTAGTPSGGVVSIQGVTSGQAVPISGTVTATNSANANTGGAVPTQATMVGGTDGTDLRALSVNTSGQLNVNNISGTISLPTGAATSANQTSVIGSASGGTAATNSELSGGIYNSSAPTLTTGQQASLQLTSSGALITSTSVTSTVVTSSTSTITSVAAAASSTSLLASNSSRKGAYFFNDSTATLYLAFASSASTTAYTVQIASNGFYEMPNPAVYTGAIFGIWSSATGNVRITELS